MDTFDGPAKFTELVEFSGKFLAMRAKCLVVLTTLVVGLQPITVSQADTLNPPKIVNVIQVTKGPYRPGDVITYSVVTTGGNPGIKYIRVDSECHSQAYWVDKRFYPSWRNYPDSEFHSPTRISAIIRNCVSMKNIPVYVEVYDQTELKDWVTANTTYEVVSESRLAAGIVRPPMQTDSFVNTLPSEVDYFGTSVRIKLPRFSEKGLPLIWSGGPSYPEARSCKYVYRFEGDNPLELEILNAPSTCQLEVGTAYSEKYSQIYLPISIKVVDGLKAQAEAKAKVEAEAKAKAEAEAKAKAEAETKAKAELAASELAARELAEKPLCEARRKELTQLGETLKKYIKGNPGKSAEIELTVLRLNSALNSSCVAEVTLSDFQREAAELMKSSSKKTTITCIKGKLTKKVTAVNPKCPKGYKKR